MTARPVEPISIHRRRLLAGAAGGAMLASMPSIVRARQSYRILMITYRGQTEAEVGFLEYLHSSGLVIDIVHRDIDRDIHKLPAILSEMPGLAPDLVYTWGTPVTLGVAGTYDAPDPSGMLRDTPLVFALVSAPVGARIVPALSEQGRPVTGAVHVVPTATQLRAMAAYRAFSKVGLIYSTIEQNSQIIASEVSELCAANGQETLHRTFHNDANGMPTADGVETMLEELRNEGADWLYFVPDTFLGTIYNRIMPASILYKLPTFGTTELAVREYSALTGLISRYRSVGQLAAVKALQILKDNTPASDIPIETLKRFALLVNLHTARALGGFYPPIEMLNYAEIITHGPADSGFAA